MKNLKNFGLTSLLLMGLFVFAACGGDDDESGSPSAPGVVTGKEDGQTISVRVTSVGNARFYYKENGRLDYAYLGGLKYYFSDNNTLTNDDDDIETKLSFNGAGYLTKISASWSYKDGNDSYTGSGQYTMSYDGSGRLVKITETGKESGKEDGESFSSSGSGSCVLTWKDNAIQKVVWDAKYTDDGEAETEKYTTVFKYDEDIANKYSQMTPSVARSLNYMEDLYELAYVGLLGKGSIKLPTSAAETWTEYYDGRSHDGSHSESYGYGFNSNGTVNYNTINGTRYSFSYEDLSDEMNAKPMMPLLESSKRGRLHRRLHRASL